VKYQGKVSFIAEPLKVWEVVMDIDQFAACMPGVEELTRIDERTFDGVMKAKVGPISGEVRFRAQILESTPPTQLTSHVDGIDSLTKSSVTSNITMDLVQGSPGETELTYLAEVNIKGRLAIIGDMVIRATGAQVIDEFFKRLREKIKTAPV
jgi:carbon monoxide dehydrogenase subunit G